jgi:gas vesicle protein
MANGQGIGLAQVIQQHRANRESEFFSSLLQYGMASGGQFDIENGVPIYTGAGEMPDKTQLWNRFLKLKGGRLSSQDIMNFESAYKQAESMRVSKQVGELGKLRTRGYSDKEIRKSVSDNPVLYNSLIDLVSDLEQSGDENAFAQAQSVKMFLPEVDKGGLLGDIASGEGGMLGNLIGPGVLFGAPSAYAYARGRGAESVSKAAKDFRTQRRAVTSDINDAKKNLDSKTKAIKDKAKTISEKQKKLKKPKASKPLQNLRKDKRTLTSEKKKLQTKINDLTKKRQDIKIKDPGSRISRLKGKGFRPGLGTAFAASYFAPEVGEFIAGEKGRKPASLLTNLGLLGYGLATKNPSAALTGGIGLGAQGYDYFFGDE